MAKSMDKMSSDTKDDLVSLQDKLFELTNQMGDILDQKLNTTRKIEIEMGDMSKQINEIKVMREVDGAHYIHTQITNLALDLAEVKYKIEELPTIPSADEPINIGSLSNGLEEVKKEEKSFLMK